VASIFKNQDSSCSSHPAAAGIEGTIASRRLRASGQVAVPIPLRREFYIYGIQRALKLQFPSPVLLRLACGKWVKGIVKGPPSENGSN
jgi:hypothetical protein